MSKLNNQKIGLNSIFNKLREKYNEVDTAKRSLSRDVLFDYSEEVIIRNIYRKTKIRLNKPKKLIELYKANEKRAKSASRKKSKQKSFTYKKRTKNKLVNNLVYSKHIFSAQNKILKIEKNNIRIVRQFNVFPNYSMNIMQLIKIIKKVYFKKIKNNLKLYLKKEANNNDIKNIDKKMNFISSSCDKKSKEKMNLAFNNNKESKNNKSTSAINRKKSSKRSCFEENLKIIKRIDVKRLYNSEDENNNFRENTYNKKDNLIIDNLKGIINFNYNSHNSYSNCKIKEKENNDIKFLDILKKLKKDKINRIKTDCNNKSLNDNQFIPNIAKKRNNEKKIYYNKYISYEKVVNNNNISTCFNKNEFANHKQIYNNYNNIDFGIDNNLIIKQNQNQLIYSPYDSKESKKINKKKDLNKNYKNNINISYNNIISDNKKINSEEKCDNYQNLNEIKTNKKNKYINDINYVNIINLISPIKENNYYIENKMDFRPDKNNSKKVKIYQVNNTINEIKNYFEKYENTKNNNILINENFQNEQKINIALNENIIDKNKNHPINQINNQEQKILFDNSNFYSNYNNICKNPIDVFDLIKKDNDKDELKNIKEYEIRKLSKDSNTIKDEIINLYDIDNPLDIKNYSNNEMNNENLNGSINTNFKNNNNDFNTYGNEDKFMYNNINKNNKEKNNNKKEYINNNIIEKNGDFFYSVKSSDNTNIICSNLNNKIKNNNDLSLSLSSSNKNEKSINDIKDIDDNEDVNINPDYFKYKIIDKEKKIIYFLYNKYGKKYSKFKAKIRLHSYLNIIQRTAETEKDNNKEDYYQEINTFLDNESQNNKIIKPISIRFYKNFIKKLIDEVSTNGYINYNAENSKNDKISNIILQNIQKLDYKINCFKKYILYLLIKKHYLETNSEKEKLIKNKAEKIEEHKKDIYIFYNNLKNSIKLIKEIKYNNQKKEEYILMILDILKKYENISHKDIKFAKNYFNERKKKKRVYNKKIREILIHGKNSINSTYKFNYKKNKLNMKLIAIVIPLVYIFNYLITYQKDYSLIDSAIIN